MYAVKFFVIMGILFNLVCVSNANSATITAASCSLADVQAAVDSATDGDIVSIPAGSSTWNSYVSIPSTKGLTIQGAGIGSTLITDGVGYVMIDIVGIEGKPWRVTGLTIKDHGGSQGVFNVRGTCKNFRIDHIKFENLTGRAINITGFSYGVIDNCQFQGTNGQNCVLVSYDNPGDTAWETALSLGTEHAVYVEDSNFSFTNMEPGNTAIDARGGARIAFRYNTLDNILIGTHGTAVTTYRTALSWEFYNNTLHTDNAILLGIGQQAGGTGVIFSNRFKGPFNSMCKLSDYRTCCGLGYSCNPKWSRCDGNDPIDGNTPGMMGYPCYDQIGRAPDSDGDGIQDLEPVYEWDNLIDYDDNGSYEINGNFSIVSQESSGCIGPSIADHIQKNRDFYNDTQKPGYTSYTYPHPLRKPFPPMNLKTQQF